MGQDYQITGMTCNGCRKTVETLLKGIPGVIDVSVDLEKSAATIQMNTAIDLSIFRDVLPDKFTILENKKSSVGTNSNSLDGSQSNTFRQLFPLFLIFGYITSTAIGLNYKAWSLGSFMLDFMGLFYIVFSFFKILDLKGFSQSFRMYDPLAKALPIYGWVYPFIEVGLGLLFLTRFEISIALIATIVILGITTIGVTKVLIDKKSIQCACLGTVMKLPMTKATFIENTIMLVMAIWMLSKIFF